ncbi:high mobility group nucleosome-binding domain-containing protein 5 [Nothobranchius furzeri]|nr:zinc finger CCCH domain-containing protein 13 [Nothobranchius furzeri]
MSSQAEDRVCMWGENRFNMLTRWLTFITLLGSADSVTVAPTCRVKGELLVQLLLRCGEGKSAGEVQFWHTPFGDLQTSDPSSDMAPVFLDHDGRLVIPSCSTHHAGLYYCIQHHPHGSTLWSYELHVGHQNQNRSQEVTSRFRRSFRLGKAVVSDGLFTGAVTASVLLTFTVGFSAGALARTRVVRCLLGISTGLRLPRKRHCQTDMPDHSAQVTIATLPLIYDNQVFEAEAMQRDSKACETPEKSVSMTTPSPPAKPKRSFRHKRHEEQEATAYLEGRGHRQDGEVQEKEITEDEETESEVDEDRCEQKVGERSDERREAAGEQEGRDERREAAGEQEGRDERPEAAGEQEGKDERREAAGEHEGKDERREAAGEQEGRDERPEAAGEQEGKDERREAAGEHEGKDERREAAGEHEGKDERREAAGEHEGKDERREAAGEHEGKDERPEAAGEHEGKDERPEAAGEHEGRDERREAAGEQEGRDERREAAGEQEGKDERREAAGEQEGKDERREAAGEQEGKDERREAAGEQEGKDERREAAGEHEGRDESEEDQKSTGTEEKSRKNKEKTSSCVHQSNSRIIRLYQYDEDGQRFSHLPEPDCEHPEPGHRLRLRSKTRLNAIMMAASTGPTEVGGSKQEQEGPQHFHMEI